MSTLPPSRSSELAQSMTDRRSVMKASLALGTSFAALGAGEALAAAAPARFAHGVASGDPMPGQVIIWTRVTPRLAAELLVLWEVATDPGFVNIMASGSQSTSAAVDYTVKVDVQGLQPNTGYHYRFRSVGVTSPGGFTRTLPEGNVDQIKLAVFSCSNFSKGYFNAYAAAANLKDLNAILHLGDWMYEYAPGGYNTTSLAFGLATEYRTPQLMPQTETTVLDDYRARHATYRSDTDLKKLSAKAPWIVIWDDHEITNDGWTGGAENHNPGEVDWQARKEAAIQAYYEWMPIREPSDGFRVDPDTGNPRHMFRAFDFGGLAKLIMLDTRFAGRNKQLNQAQFLGQYFNSAGGTFPLDLQASGAPRTLMGTEQEAWFAGQIAQSNTSGQTWQVIGNQVLMFFQNTADYLNSARLSAIQKAQLSGVIDSLFGPGAGTQFGQLGALGAPNPATNDSWMGYPKARNLMLATLAQARNPVVLSGDSHNFWAAELKVPTPAGRFPIATEFGVAGVTSPGYEQIFPQIPGVLDLDPAVLADVLVDTNLAHSPSDRLVYADTVHRGYMTLKITRDEVITSFNSVSTVGSRAFTTTQKKFRVKAGVKLIEAI